MLSVRAFARVDLDFTSSSTKAAKIFKLTRMVRLGKLARRLENVDKGVQISKLLGIVLLLLHWVTCGWRMIGDEWYCRGPGSFIFDNGYLREAVYVTTEQLRDDLTQDDCPEIAFGPFRRYLRCLYQASTSLFAGGLAYTAPEQIYFAIVVVIGAMLQASVFGSVASLVRSFDEDRLAYERKMHLILYNMDFLGVPEGLADRVLQYYENMWQYHRSLGETTATSFITELSRPLQVEIKINLFLDMLLKIPFLQSIDVVVVEEILMRLQSKAFMSGDIVIRKGDAGDWMGFISHGIIAVLDPRQQAKDVVMKLLRVGSYFGELSLLENMLRSASLHAFTWVQLEVFGQQDWLELGKMHPEEMELCRREIRDTVERRRYVHKRESAKSTKPTKKRG